MKRTPLPEVEIHCILNSLLQLIAHVVELLPECDCHFVVWLPIVYRIGGSCECYIVAVSIVCCEEFCVPSDVKSEVISDGTFLSLVDYSLNELIQLVDQSGISKQH